MARKNKGKDCQNENTQVHFGINQKTLKVETVWQQRNGTLTKGAFIYRCSGKNPRSEVAIVFGLTNIKTVPIIVLDSMGAKVEAELEELAKEMRAATAAEAAQTPASAPSPENDTSDKDT